MNAPLLVAIAFAALNLWTFAVYGYDKTQSRRGGGRVPERRLLTLAAIGGSPAALLARRLFRHKTRKQPFVNHLRAILCLQCLILAGAACWVIGAP